MKNHSRKRVVFLVCFWYAIRTLLLFFYFRTMDETIIAGDRKVLEITRAESLLDRLARWSIFASFFLLPIFAVPYASVPFGFSKTALFIILTALAGGLWAIARLRDGEISFPRTALFPILIALVAVGAASTLFSGAVALSWSGAFFDVGSLSFLAALILFLFLFAALIRSAEQVFYAYLLFFVSAGLVALFHLIRFIGGPDMMSFGFFGATTSTLLERWNDLGVFFGAVVVFTLTTLEFVRLRAGLRALLVTALALSLIILAVVNFTLVWLLLGIFSLVFLVYLISFKHISRAGFEDVRLSVSPQNAEAHAAEEGENELPRKIPIISLLVFACSVMFILFGGPLGNKISGKLSIVAFDARPSFGATLSVARETLKDAPFFGAGPNMFVRKWLAFKPIGANQTIFWNTDFSSGVGYLPTVLVTTGLLGAAMWLLFLVWYMWLGMRFILSLSADKVMRYLVGASFLTSLFLWCVLFFYSAGAVILALAFAFTGLSLAALSCAGALHRASSDFSKSPAFSFAGVLGLIIFTLGCASVAYGVGNRFVSAVWYAEGVRAANEQGNAAEAERLIARAVERAPLDVYMRALAEVSLAQMNTLLAQVNEQNADAMRESFQLALGHAVEYGKSATALDVGNYANWLSLGRVYEAIVPLKIGGAYENARSAYEEALRLNPKNPAITLSIARLEAAKGDNARAREFIGQSLQLKPNYTEAIFFLSQVEVQEGNIKDAIQSVESATIFAPNDSSLRFQLGLLKYNEKDFRGAADAFARAVALNENYANARYFLGLSYERLNRDSEAVAQFEWLAKTNPSNKEVALILGNLKAGRAPFADALPPVDEKPEQRPSLPVQENKAGGNAVNE